MPDEPPLSAVAPRAVFLSYASQDAEAATRICAALRGAGIEVWFDQSELVGGDVWDAKIRGQIASCALFVPVISAATQARREGYFRLEWKLAAQRTHMISERTAFLLPVVIDATRDAEADVPGEFRAVQWTRLPGGIPPPQLVERVQTLLGAPIVGPLADRAPDQRSGLQPKPVRSKSRWRVPAIIALVAVAILAVWQPWKTPSAPAAAQPPSDLAAKSDAKSVAVLAFANMSADKDTEYFSDGISN